MSTQNTGQPAAEQKQVVQQKSFQESTVNEVLSRIQAFQSTGELRLPADYSPENALKSAWLYLQSAKDRNDKPVLEVCTKASIANALLDMVTKGLSIAKKQGYFIPYGNTLTFDESYLGTIAIAKRDADVSDVNPNVIYEGDVFKYSIDPKTGRKSIEEHQQDFDNIDTDKIKGAYSIVLFKDGSIKVEIMTMKQIRQAWMQGQMKGNSPAHKNFPDQMAMRTVIGRSLKLEIGSSDDSSLMAGDAIANGVKVEIKEKANAEAIGFDQPQAANVVSTTVNETLVQEPVAEEVGGPGY